jgi:hypothetical protein
MAIYGYGLPARCYQPDAAEGVIYADLWGEPNTHLTLQASFTQSSPVHNPLLQAFPFPSTLGEVTLHPLSLACVFVYSSHGKWVFTPLLLIFPPSTTLTSFPTSGCWAHDPAPTGASLARPGLFIYSSRKDSPPAGDVEESKACLFLVVLPARCVSSISPRFHCRWHAFCFLPLASIFESLLIITLFCFIFLFLLCRQSLDHRFLLSEKKKKT